MSGWGVRLGRRGLVLAVSRGGVACAVTALAALLCPGSATAQTYEVVSCNSAPGGVNNAWTLSATGSAGGSAQCPAGTGLR